MKNIETIDYEPFEHIYTTVFDSDEQGSHFVGDKIIETIKQNDKQNKKTVIGLSTGASPIKLYKYLISNYQDKKVSFKNVITFNLDEYFPIDKKSTQSYWHFMHTMLFDHIDIIPSNINMLDGAYKKENLRQHLSEYEHKIKKLGGIDLMILGIGANGHIGFNEPGSIFFSTTRLVSLSYETRLANSSYFESFNQVPRTAISMGIHTIMQAKKIFLLAWGSSKASAIAQAVEGTVTEQLPASVLQQHEDCHFIIDQGAAELLTRINAPWMIGDCIWTPMLIKKAVVQLSLKLKKPVLSLTTTDYNEHGLNHLLAEKGDAYEVNLQVYYMLRDTITGWPGGKPNVALINHPERSIPYPKKVVIFSPHPDDDIISMGGTMQRLQDQGHEVHIAYQTSGNIAVHDDFVQRFLDFVEGFEKLCIADKLGNNLLLNNVKNIRGFINNKDKQSADELILRQVKGLIRRCEAIATCRFVGIPESRIHFQNLPFYETGQIKKKEISIEDIQMTVDLLNTIKPHQIYCAGDLLDPHGTHKKCLQVVQNSVIQLKNNQTNWLQDCYVWLYRGAWEEWAIEEIEMAIPMSPDQVIKKRHGIFNHQSQKDIVPFLGKDNREFWQRAEERNAKTAILYSQLGLTQYAAIEAFVRWHF
ncbi:MAG: glucosamine-6-phosphate deaminase [Phycisphaerales bacterium]|nr:glucosamine-6-phosphate deaminase [Phycisphaerales bacterium]